MRLIIIHLILTLFISAQIKKLQFSSKITQPQVTKLIDISNEMGNFYKRLSSCRLENGHIAILDIGNYRVKIFNSKGKLVNTIGRKGQGPGEFDGLDKIFAFNQGFVVRSNYKLSYYDQAGDFIKDVSLIRNGQVSHPIIIKENLYTYFKGNSKLSHIIYDKSLNEIKSIPNSNYNRTGIKEDDSVLLSKSTRVISSDKYLYEIPYGPFRILKKDLNFKVIEEFTFDIEPIIRDPKKIIDTMVFDKSLKGDKLKKAKQYEYNLLIKQLSIYENSIVTIAGFYNGKLVIQLKNKYDNEIELLFIVKNEITSTLILPNTYADEIKIFEDQIFICKNNDIDGPSLSIYKINF